MGEKGKMERRNSKAVLAIRIKLTSHVLSVARKGTSRRNARMSQDQRVLNALKKDIWLMIARGRKEDALIAINWGT